MLFDTIVLTVVKWPCIISAGQKLLLSTLKILFFVVVVVEGIYHLLHFCLWLCEMQDQLWIWFGRGLAAMNAIYYSLNLFGFLIPFFLPRAFEQYFHDRDQHLREHPPKDKKHPKPLPTPASPAAKKAE